MMNIYSITLSRTNEYGTKVTAHYYEDANNVAEANVKFLERAEKEKIQLDDYDNISYSLMVQEV